jgi:hypothetical protein
MYWCFVAIYTLICNPGRFLALILDNNDTGSHGCYSCKSSMHSDDQYLSFCTKYNPYLELHRNTWCSHWLTNPRFPSHLLLMPLFTTMHENVHATQFFQENFFFSCLSKITNKMFMSFPITCHALAPSVWLFTIYA